MEKETVRQIAMRTFKSEVSSIHHEEAMPWHWWKRAYDSAYNQLVNKIAKDAWEACGEHKCVPGSPGWEQWLEQYKQQLK